MCSVGSSTVDPWPTTPSTRVNIPLTSLTLRWVPERSWVPLHFSTSDRTTGVPCHRPAWFRPVTDLSSSPLSTDRPVTKGGQIGSSFSYVTYRHATPRPDPDTLSCPHPSRYSRLSVLGRTVVSILFESRREEVDFSLSNSMFHSTPDLICSSSVTSPSGNHECMSPHQIPGNAALRSYPVLPWWRRSRYRVQDTQERSKK